MQLPEGVPCGLTNKRATLCGARTLGYPAGDLKGYPPSGMGSNSSPHQGDDAASLLLAAFVQKSLVFNLDHRLRNWRLPPFLRGRPGLCAPPRAAAPPRLFGAGAALVGQGT